MKIKDGTVENLSVKRLFYDLTQIRQRNPLIHNITNLVVMPITANLLLALGASPLMAHAQQELAEIIALSRALVINIGTLDNPWIDSIAVAQKLALQAGIPIVLDPVGAGASRYRTETAKQILERGVTLIRGNASEIMALCDPTSQTKGVDSIHASHHALAAATLLAKHYHCTVVVTGKTDLIVNAARYQAFELGTPLFTKVVGMGCTLTAMIASFLTVNPSPFLAAVHAVALFGLLGELAEQRCAGPGSFYTHLIDSLYTIKPTDIEPLISRSARSLCP
jgi:hydroxyethylthiazole kinase